MTQHTQHTQHTQRSQRYQRSLPILPTHRSITTVPFPYEMLDIEGMTAGTVLIYAYILHQSKMSKNYYESQENIAATTRQSVATVKRAIKQLQEQQLLVVSKVKHYGGVSNVYKVRDFYMDNDE